MNPSGWFLWSLLSGAVWLPVFSVSVLAQQQVEQATDPRQREAQRLFEQGRAAAKARDFRNAIPLYEKALKLREQVLGKEHAELVSLTDALGAAHWELGNHAAALSHYRRSLAIDEKVLGPDHAQVAADLNNLAGLYESMGEYAKALPLYQRSLAILEKAFGPRHPHVATGLNNLAALYESMGEYAKALPLYQRSLSIREQALGPGHPDLAGTLNNLAALYRSMGEYAKALPLFQRSLATYEKALGPEHLSVATSLNNLAALYRSMGEYAKALPLYQRSLAIDERALGRDHAEVATDLNNLAGLYRAMGEHEKALQLYQRALAILEKALGFGHPNLAATLNNLAGLYREMAEYAKALPLYQRSLAILEKALGPAHPSVATVLNNLAELYRAMGEYARTLPLYERSLAAYEKALGPEHSEVAGSLNNLAGLYWSLGEYAKALPLFQRSLAIDEKALGPGHPRVATNLNNLALLYVSMGKHAKALPLHERSLAIYEKALGPEHPSVATGLNNLAELLAAKGEYGEALALRERALLIASQANVPDTVWRVQDGLRVLLARAGQTEVAIFFGKQAVNTIQGMRARLTELERGLQRSFLEDKTGVYRGLADLLIEQGRLAEAQQVLGMLKEEEFFDFIRRSESDDPRRRRIAFLGYERPWHERLQQLIGRLRRIGAEKRELERQTRLGLAEADRTKLAALDQESAEAARELGRFHREIAAAFATPAVTHAPETTDALANRAALQKTLATLGAGSVMLHYVQAEERLNIIVTTETSQVARRAPVRSADLNRQIDRLRRVLRNPRSNSLPAAQDLYRVLIAPVAADLERAGARTLMLYLDGALRYIPLAVLHDGSQFLAERYALAVYTEVARENLTNLPPDGRTIAGLGLTRAIEEYAALPAVKAELEAIVKTGGTGLIPGEVHLDEHFSARVMQQALARGRPLVHIASHFVFRPGTEAASFLLLGDGDRLTLKRIRDEKFDFGRVDLLTFSACETGLDGGRDAEGQEIEGLGVLVQKRGAKGVIATLWPVADESTARFMHNLYRLREEQKLTKAEALRQAQISFIREMARVTEGAAGASTSPSYAHPFYWAPFILMGNWL